jgi:hypothetical protein
MNVFAALSPFFLTQTVLLGTLKFTLSHPQSLNVVFTGHQNSCRKWSSTQPHTVYNVHLLWEEGRGGQREGRGATVHKYSSFVRGGNSSQAGSKIPTMSECISSP